MIVNFFVAKEKGCKNEWMTDPFFFFIFMAKNYHGPWVMSKTNTKVELERQDHLCSRFYSLTCIG